MSWEPMSWEYIAGFTDGEGHIGSQTNEFGVSSFRVVLYQNVAQVEILHEIAEFLQASEIDARLYAAKRPVDKRHPTVGWYLSVRRQLDVYEFLTHARPFLRVKA